MRPLVLALLLAGCGSEATSEDPKVGVAEEQIPNVCPARVPLPDGMHDGVFDGWARFGPCVPSTNGAEAANDPYGDGRDAILVVCVCCVVDETDETCGWSWENP